MFRIGIAYLEIVNHVWRIFFTYKNYLCVPTASLFLGSLSFSLLSKAMFPYAKNVFVSYLAQRKDSRVPGGWMRLTYWKGAMLFLTDQRNECSISVDLTRQRALRCLSQNINAFFDSVFNLVFFLTFARNSFLERSTQMINLLLSNFHELYKVYILLFNISILFLLV